LRGVVGRKAASGAFSAYSTALKKSGLTWTPATLNTFLTAPGKLVTGTRMVVMVPDARQRADIIAWLGTQR
jgi:cytochrome c